MNIRSMRRWQWVVISLLVGAGGGALWQQYCGDVTNYGESITAPETFENALITIVQGRPRFTDLSVHRQTLKDDAGIERTRWIVVGNYCGSAGEAIDGGYQWRPGVHVAEDPYHLHLNPAEIFGTRRDITKAFQKIPSPTVLDFLKALSEARGIHVTHAWWRTYPMLLWLGGSFVGIGVIWPTVINLLVFRRLTRPREEKGTALTAVKPAPAAGSPVPTKEDQDRLRELEGELEAKLVASAGPAKPAPTGRAPAPVVQLDGAASVPTAPPHDEAHTVFGTKKDDFYPTERHVHPKETPKK